jgi:hypothetical protein
MGAAVQVTATCADKAGCQRAVIAVERGDMRSQLAPAPTTGGGPSGSGHRHSHPRTSPAASRPTVRALLRAPSLFEGNVHRAGAAGHCHWAVGEGEILTFPTAMNPCTRSVAILRCRCLTRLYRISHRHQASLLWACTGSNQQRVATTTYAWPVPHKGVCLGWRGVSTHPAGYPTREMPPAAPLTY